MVANIILFMGCGSTAATADRLEEGFSGRWRIDTATIKSNSKPTKISLRAGRFKKDKDDEIFADGKFHHVNGGGYIDQTSISVESDHIVSERDMIKGKLIYTVKYVVSDNGNTLNWLIASFTDPNGQIVHSQTTQRRVGQRVRGAHLISGEWERVAITMDQRSDWILKLDGKNFSWRMGGVGYDAKIGGQPVTIDGDASGAMAKIHRPQPDTIVETDLSNKGVPSAQLTMTLVKGGKTIKVTTQAIPKKDVTIFFMRKIN